MSHELREKIERFKAVHLALRVKAGAGRAPQAQQVAEVLALLSNSVLSILEKEEQGFMLRMSAATARKRIEALESMFGVEEVATG